MTLSVYTYDPLLPSGHGYGFFKGAMKGTIYNTPGSTPAIY